MSETARQPRWSVLKVRRDDARSAAWLRANRIDPAMLPNNVVCVVDRKNGTIQTRRYALDGEAANVVTAENEMAMTDDVYPLRIAPEKYGISASKPPVPGPRPEVEKATTDTDEWYSTEELAALLKVPVKTIRTWRYRGAGPRGASIGRHVRYRRVDVESWIQTQLDPIGEGA